MEKERENKTNRAPLAAGLISGVCCLAVYLVTLAPTAVDGDGGELVSAAYYLGIPHPTGYPLYMLLARLFIFLPFSNPAVRVGVLSALAASGAVFAVAWAAARLTRSTLAGIAAGLAAGLNRPMWSQATIAEVYALNALFVALAILVYVEWREAPSPRKVVWLAVVTSLGLTHHRTAIFFTAPLLAAAWFAQRPRPSLVKMLAALLLPLSLYLYLPIRSLAHPAVMWQDLSHWDKFFIHVTGREYLIYSMERPVGQALALAGKIITDFGEQLTLGGTLLCIIGLVALFRRKRMFSLCLIAASAALTIWNLFYYVTDVMDFFVPVWLALGIWLAEGTQVIRGALKLVARGRAAWTPTAFAVVVAVVAGGGMTQHNWARCDQHDRWRDYDRSRAILAQIPKGGIYSPYRDDFLMMYLQQIEKFRRDVRIIRGPGFYMAGQPYLAKPPLSTALAQPVQHFLESTDVGSTVEQRRAAAVRFARELGANLGWKVPVYAGVEMRSHPAGQPNVLALWWDLYRAVPDATPRETPSAGRGLGLELTPGVVIERCRVTPSKAKPRDLLQVSLDFRCREPVNDPVRVGILLAPEGTKLTNKLLRNMLMDYDTWLMYGALPLPANSEGHVYRQTIPAVVPTNAPAGNWGVYLRVGRTKEEWAQVYPVGEFIVKR